MSRYRYSNVKVNPWRCVIVADDTSIAVVPADKAKDILKQCQQIEETEKQIFFSELLTNTRNSVIIKVCQMPLNVSFYILSLH